MENTTPTLKFKLMDIPDFNDLDRFLVDGWKPECKQDVVDLLMLVQSGYISCRKASDILFPEFNHDPLLSNCYGPSTSSWP